MERLEFDLLFRWFVGLGIDDPAWDHSVFSKNRDRLLEGEIAAKFLAAVLVRLKRRFGSALYDTYRTCQLGPQPRDGGDSNEPPAGGGRNADVNFRGAKRSNQTHVSTSDPDAMLYRKGRAWKPSSASSVTP